MTYNRHYCYRIDFADGYVYFGVRSCNCDPAEDTSYMGSPTTHAAKWLTDIPRVKSIVSVHATRELVMEAEAKLILAFWAVSKELSLNASVNGAKFHVLGTAWYTDGATSIRLGDGDSIPVGFRPGRTVADETCAKISKAVTGKKWYTDGATCLMLSNGDTVPEGFELGRTSASDETRTKISAAGKGRKHTEEARAKMSKPKPAGHGANVSAAQVGKKLTAEHRAKLSAASKGKKRTAEHCASIGAVTKGSKWYTNGVANMRLQPSEVIPEGFRPGRAKKAAL